MKILHYEKFYVEANLFLSAQSNGKIVLSKHFSLEIMNVIICNSLPVRDSVQNHTI